MYTQRPCFPTAETSNFSKVTVDYSFPVSGEYGAQVKNNLDSKFQFPNWLFSCSLVSTFQILHSLHLVSGLMVITGYCAALCEKPHAQMLTNAHPVLDAQHKNFTL